jgi:hypothetical protein
MARAPVQLDEKVKEDLEALNGEFSRCKTGGDRVEKLIAYYHQSEKMKRISREDEEKAEAARKANMIHLGSDLKQSYNEFQARWGYRSEASGFSLLLEHFNSSDKFGISVIELIPKLR